MEERTWNEIILNPNKGRKRVKREQSMDETKRKHQDDRFKPNPINNHIKMLNA